MVVPNSPDLLENFYGITHIRSIIAVAFPVDMAFPVADDAFPCDVAFSGDMAFPVDDFVFPDDVAFSVDVAFPDGDVFPDDVASSDY